MVKDKFKTHARNGFDPSYFELLFKIEDQHFWFKARNRVIGTLVNQVIDSSDARSKVLEVGCGTGNILRVLGKSGKGNKVVGMDLFAEGLQYARRRTSCLLVQGDVSKPPFNESFDLIGVFDVLEHCDSDLLILSNLYDLVKRDGALILTVPAHPSLWSYFDESSHHRRRYTLKELKSKLNQSGFRIEYITEYMATIFPIVWLKRKLSGPIYRNRTNEINQAYDNAKSELRIIPVINNLLNLLLSFETGLIKRRLSLPFGTSIIAVARKDN